MNEEKLRRLFESMVVFRCGSARLENWIVHTLMSAVEREADHKILDELERLAK